MSSVFAVKTLHVHVLIHSGRLHKYYTKCLTRLNIFIMKNNKWKFWLCVSCWHILTIQVTVDVLNFPALASLSFSFHSNLYICDRAYNYHNRLHKLISWTLVLEIDNYVKRCEFIHEKTSELEYSVYCKKKLKIYILIINIQMISMRWKKELLKRCRKD